METVTRLYPAPQEEVDLKGLYLQENLLGEYKQTGKIFVFSNFILSLDGRIAVPHPTEPGMIVPGNTANPRDWRLLQELQAQAEVVISTGRYLRDYAAGRAQENLKVFDDPEFADLAQWRADQGLTPQPDLVVLSTKLEFPVPKELDMEKRKVILITSAQAAPDRVKQLEGLGCTVIVGGEESVRGAEIINALTERGYRTVFAASGPQVFHTFLSAGFVQRLYLTYAHRILGGNPFSSFVQGDLLAPAADLRLRSLYLDTRGLDGLGQMFASYDVVKKGSVN